MIQISAIAAIMVTGIIGEKALQISGHRELGQWVGLITYVGSGLLTLKWVFKAFDEIVDMVGNFG